MLYIDVLFNSFSLRYPFRVISNVWSTYISGSIAPKPFKLKIENTLYCNLKCNMCPHADGMKRKKGNLNFERFKYIFDQVEPCYLNLTGIGEPLMNPDIFKIITYGRKGRAFVKLDTNAMMLNEENSRKMLDANPNILSISLDGMTKKTFEDIRTGGNFKTVISNIRKFSEMKQRLKSSTELHLFMVVQKKNLNEVIDYIKFGEEIKADSINGTFVISLGLNENNKTTITNCKKEDLERLRVGLKQAKKKLGNKLKMDNLIGYLDEVCIKGRIETRGYNSDKPCYLPWYAPYITWDGNVSPCDFYCENEIVFGNVFEEPFMKIWNNRKAQEFRRNLVRRRTGICTRCGVEEDFIYNSYWFLRKIPILNRLTYRK